MPIYNDIKQCQNCGKILTEKENVRVRDGATLRFCDKCWADAMILMEKIKPLWEKAGL